MKVRNIHNSPEILNIENLYDLKNQVHKVLLTKFDNAFLDIIG